MTESRPRCVWPARALLGEGPMWTARDKAVYWVDIKGQLLHRLALTDESKKSWPMPERVGWVVERSDQPGFVAGEKLDRLFVTSAAIGLSKEQLAAEPLAGSLFEVAPGCTGLPTRQFRG